MNSMACLNTPRRALCRAFVSPTKHYEAAASLQRQGLPLAQSSLPTGQVPQPPTSLYVTALSSRSFGTSLPRPRVVKPKRPTESAAAEQIREEKELGYDPRFTTQRALDRSGRGRMPRDHEITDPRVMVVREGTLDGPFPTRTTISRLGEDQSLRMVKPYVPARPKDNVPAEFAVCQVVNKREEFAREREEKARKQLAKATATKTKELEVNWAIAEHDLATKVRHLGRFLEKGMRVAIAFGKKRGSKRVGADEAAAVVAAVRAAVEENGGKEYKPAEGNLGLSMRLFVERAPSKAQPAAQKQAS